jgi:hypothetical protein
MMMQRQPIFVTTQGMISRNLLENSRKAVITGTTSRGVFIRLDSDWVLFLSFESYHGPLTLNLSGGKSILKVIEVNDRIVTLDGKILIPSTGIEIDYSRAERWESLPPSGILLSDSSRIGSLKAIANLIFSQKKEPGLYLVLKDMLAIQLDGLPLVPKAFEQVDCIRMLQLLKTKDLERIFSALSPFLGLGAGLTPSGDDMILGLLLAYRRWGTVLKTAFDLAKLNDRLKQAASQKTTLLSANLITCASQGQADELLINALDGIMTGSPSPDQCARDLSDWGNSSGRDALVGMALAILSASA